MKTVKKDLKIGRWIAKMRRAQLYVSLLNSSMIFIILLNSFQVRLNWYWYPLMVIGTLCTFLGVGDVETRSGIRSAELMDNEKNRPILMEMHENIKKLLK